MALTVPGGYCSHVALHSRHYQDTSTSHHNNRISISPPWREKMARPHARCGFIGGQKKGEGWLILVTFIGVVLVAGLLAGTWILECPVSPLMASPSRFLPPLVESCFKHCRVDCSHLVEMSLSKACKVLQQENLSQGILWPVPFRGAPISAPRASLPVISPGNSRLDSKMAVLSP